MSRALNIPDTEHANVEPTIELIDIGVYTTIKKPVCTGSLIT